MGMVEDPIGGARGEEARPTWLERWSPVGGLLFVALLLFTFLSPAGDGPGDTPQEVIEYATENSGWVDWTLIAGLLSLILLTWFVGGLHAHLRRLDPGSSGAVALVGGTVFTVLEFLTMVIWAAPLVELDDETGARQTSLAETYLGIEDIGWVVLGGAGIGAGLMIVAASLAALRAGWVGGWLGWVGVALGVIALATIAFVGIFAWLLWIVLASVAMLVRTFRAQERVT